MPIDDLTWDPYILDGVWQVEAVRGAQRACAEQHHAFASHGELRRFMLLQEARAERFVTEYERIFQITLPQTYRSFVLTVGDAGWLKSTALRQLGAPLFEGEWPRGIVHFDTANNDNLLALPFDPQVTYPCSADASDDIRTPAGLLYLADYGCAIWDGLVVAGPNRGEMMRIDGADSCAAVHVGSDEAGDPVVAGFAEWYCAQLDGVNLSGGENLLDRAQR